MALDKLLMVFQIKQGLSAHERSRGENR